MYGAIEVSQVKREVEQVNEELTGDAEGDVEHVGRLDSPLARERVQIAEVVGVKNRPAEPDPKPEQSEGVRPPRRGSGIRKCAQSAGVVGQRHSHELEERSENLTGEESYEAGHHDCQHSRPFDWFGVDQ